MKDCEKCLFMASVQIWNLTVRWCLGYWLFMTIKSFAIFQTLIHFVIWLQLLKNVDSLKEIVISGASSVLFASQIIVFHHPVLNFPDICTFRSPGRPLEFLNLVLV